MFIIVIILIINKGITKGLFRQRMVIVLIILIILINLIILIILTIILIIILIIGKGINKWFVLSTDGLRKKNCAHLSLATVGNC